jgi:Domain of unknown function (DUF4296)
MHHLPVITRRIRPVTWLLVILTGGLLACQPPEAGVEKPANLLPPDRMAAVLTEIHVAEARVGRMGLRGADSSAIVYARLRQRIFARQKVDTAAFTKSYVYYAAHPQQLEKLYKIIVDTLKARTNGPGSTSAPASATHPI